MKSSRNLVSLRLTESEYTKLKVVAHAMGVSEKEAAIASILGAFKAYSDLVEKAVKEKAETEKKND
jgi:hypothetical protein